MYIGILPIHLAIFNRTIPQNIKPPNSIYVTGPAKIGHVGSQNLTTFQTFATHNFLLQYGMATQFSEIELCVI